MKKYLTAILFIVLLISISCNTDKSKGRYNTKSAIIYFEQEFAGILQNSVMVFDDYGLKEYVEMKGLFDTIRTHNISIYADGFIYNIDMVNKIGEKQIFSTDNYKINFKNPTKEELEKNFMKEEGVEEFLGKSCIKISIDNPDNKTKGYHLIWEGVPVKTELLIDNYPMRLTAVSIETDKKIPPGFFEVPRGIKIIDKIIDVKANLQ